MRRFLATLLCLASVTACDAEEDVRVLPLPPVERPTPEARLGLPEVSGTWRFAGWEIVRGDTTALERTFPSFGDIDLTQRLDSIGGSFLLAGGRSPVVGEVRRSGDLSFVTFGGGVPQRYVAGEFSQDTLWLELTSVLAPDEWPTDARAAFVREPIAEPIAWLRGARPGDEVAAPVDSLPVTPGQDAPEPGEDAGAPRGLPQQPPAGVVPGTPAPAPAQPSLPTPGPTTPGQATPQPGPQTPAAPQPQQPAPEPPPPPPPPPPPASPEPEPEPEPEDERPEPPVLLGDPVDP
ncbi:MAG: hypothetical protein WD766_11840 [Gemmatimonadota bacterium]